MNDSFSRNESELRWYAAYTRSRHEKSVAELLERKRVENFLPLYGSVRRWANGDRLVQLPLFPGYLFVRTSLAERLNILKVAGVVRIVGFNGLPTPLQDEDVDGLRQALASGLKVAPHPYLKIGRRVRITAGPLAGCQGTLVRRRGAMRVVLSIELIRRAVAVELEIHAIEPVRGSLGPAHEMRTLYEPRAASAGLSLGSLGSSTDSRVLSESTN